MQGIFGGINETQKEILEQMYRSVRFEMDMVMTVLDTYKLDSGNIKFSFKEFNVVDNLKDVCFEFTKLLDKSDEMDIKLNVYNNTIVADQMHIRRVMYNLISNAIKYKKMIQKSRLNCLRMKRTLNLRLQTSALHIQKKK